MPWRSGKPSIRWLAVGALILAYVRNGNPAALLRETAPEYSVKAAYLYHFVQYVTWPPESFDSRDSPVVIGILGKDPFGDVIDRVFAGRSAMGRRIEVRRVALEEASARCQVVFISRQDRALLTDWLRTLRDKPILSVTESPEALSAGAAINFVMEGNRLRYEINLAIVEESRLDIATPMLLSAIRILGRPVGGR
jgi:hypothetical protein